MDSSPTIALNTANVETHVLLVPIILDRSIFCDWNYDRSCSISRGPATH
jgi:hypothetical protein